ncbi:NLP/P60 protein [Syntrophobotulus glycolicus DSM 8271]|uniref:NLP/P60 protein n=1 Tax=Syntrophobotulus glycolicus (strain DSM 8271 / FlGlyR) TaxID=645991 RepID=F0SUB8_SYNGF|nr:NlpC/P60 family protein [Syntrophobotulus glycolicus]ADY56568.1 NLP/P60 protein [Syntrophobotulus glycolicus DSM 8271]
MQGELLQIPEIKPVQIRAFGLAAFFLAGISTIPPANLSISPEAVNESLAGGSQIKEQAPDNIYLMDQTKIKVFEEAKGFDSEGFDQMKAEKEGEKKVRDSIVSSALCWQGVPYQWGGQTRGGVDCSALVQKVFRENGVELPRTSFEQFRMGVGVAKLSLQEGDLVFFSTAGTGASHVGIFIGEGQFISATKNCVEIENLDDSYWSGHYRGSRRIVNT